MLLNYNFEQIILFSLNFAVKATLLPALKGNNSCKMYNFRIRVGNMQWSIVISVSCIYFCQYQNQI